MLRFRQVRVLRVACATAVVATASACGGLTEPGNLRHLGVMSAVWTTGVADASIHGPVPAITAPDTVHAGAAFLATITTVGSSGCWKAAGTEVERAAALVEVRPYDETFSDRMCLAIMVELPRTIEVSFSEPGEGLIRVEGRHMVDGIVQEDALVTLEKRIVVLGTPAGN